MKIFYSLALILFFGNNLTYAQVSINASGLPPDQSAIFDIQSSSKGLLIPRVTFNERNSIVNPAEGLIIFCTDCGLNNGGALSLFTAGEWFTVSLCHVSAPTESVHQVVSSQIIWNWNPVPDAVGYKWGTTNSYQAAIDVSSDTSRTESGISCETSYTRYVWAYNNCGYSLPVTLTQTTPDCIVCGDTLYINHVTGIVAPVDKTTTYGTVTGVTGEPLKCWISSNLGSSRQATAVNDNTELSSGWYWQFNRPQGFKYEGSTRTPNTTWITTISENFDWITANDPCSIELGIGWRVPTRSELENVFNAGNWTNWNGPWNSLLKLHAAGRLHTSNGSIGFRGSSGEYFSSTYSLANSAWRLFFSSTTSNVEVMAKTYGYSIRCIHD